MMVDVDAVVPRPAGRIRYDWSVGSRRPLARERGTICAGGWSSASCVVIITILVQCQNKGKVVWDRVGTGTRHVRLGRAEGE